PALQIKQFLLVAITFEHDVFALADTLDFLDRRFELEQSQIVKGGERNHEIKMLVPIWILVLGAIAVQPVAQFRLGIGESVPRDLKSENSQPGQFLFHLVKKIGLPPSDVEDAGAALEAIDLNQPFRDRPPPTGKIFIAAIPEAAIAVPIVSFIFL